MKYKQSSGLNFHAKQQNQESGNYSTNASETTEFGGALLPKYLTCFYMRTVYGVKYAGEKKKVQHMQMYKISVFGLDLHYFKLADSSTDPLKTFQKMIF